MNIKLELLSGKLAELVRESVSAVDIDPDGLIDTASVDLLSEIKGIIDKIMPDADTVEEIAWTMRRYGIKTAATTDQYYYFKKKVAEVEAKQKKRGK